MVGVAVEHLEDRLAHAEHRRPQRILDLRDRRGDVVGGRLAGDRDELVEAPAAGMRQHRFLHHLGVGVHQAHRVDRSGRTRHGMDMRHDPGGSALPGLGVLALEGVDAAPIGGAARLPEAAIGQCGEGMRVEADRRIEVAIVAMRRMDGLRAAHLFRGLAEEHERAADAMPLHGVLRRQEAGERAHAERRMRVGMAGGEFAYAVARLAIGHRGLRLAGHRIIFGIAGDGRAIAVRPARAEGGRHAGRAVLDFKACLPQPVDIPCEERYSRHDGSWKSQSVM